MAGNRRSGKLAVILHADVAGSTALVQQDEHLAHQRIQDTFRRFGDTITKYYGHVRELRGDALLAEFERASDAVTAALAFQADHAEYNAQLNDNIRPTVRVGIAMGEVIIADRTVTGAGVVLAQRVEQLAEPGCSCITAAIHEALLQRMPFDQENLGEKKVKGFDEPVRVYRVVLKPGESIPPPQESSRHETSPKTRTLIVAVSALVLVMAGGAAYWFKPWEQREEPASVEHMAFPLPDKPSIAVLPFTNMSGDPDQDYFSDGLTEDIITNLSRFPDLFVIARNSTFAYKGKSVTVKQVAEELGVSYLLEGSVQTADDKVRITAQLIDATTGYHLWAEDYDRELDDIFAVRDEVTASIVATLMGSDYAELRREELKQLARTDPANLDAYQQVLAAIDIWIRFTKEANEEAKQLLKKAIELDPDYPRAYTVLAWVYLNEYRYKFSDDPERSLQRAFELALKSINMDDADSWSHWALGVVYLYQGKYDESIVEYDKALSRNPNNADVFAHMGMPLTFAGEPERAIEQLKRAMRLNPNYPPWYPGILGLAYVSARQYEAAIAPLKENINRIPGMPTPHRSLAVAYAYLGQGDEANSEVETLLNLDPELSIEGVKLGLPFRHETDLEHFLEGLRKAGLPEQPPLSLPDKPSIAVLPFTNMSDDSQQEYFADGMTDDLITDLSKLSGLFVIARNSVFTYKGKPVKVRQVAEELGVRYVLEGSVRRAGDKIRINAQLIDATTGGHVWAERYDSSLTDIFALQDKITQSIVTALAVNLTAGEQERKAQQETDSPEAYDVFLRGWTHYRLHTPDDFAKAIPYFENAIELDPGFGRAHAALAAIYWEIRDNYWGKNLGVSYVEAIEKTNRHLEEAMKDPTPLAHRIAAKQQGSAERWTEAMAEAERAIALDPNDPNGYEAMSILLVDLGKAAEGLDFIEKAMRLDPQSDYLYRLGEAQFHLERYDEAAATLLRATKRNPGYEWSFLLLAAAYGHLGREQEAKSAIDTFNEVWRDTRKEERPYTLADIVDWDFKEPVDRERMREGLRKAGLPTGKAAPQREPLTADVLRSLFPGHTATGGTALGDQWHIYHVPDGRLLIRNPAGYTDEGTWEITDDGQFCRQWNSGGKKACWIYFKKGDELEYWYPDRSRMRGKFKMRPGNPENL